MNNVERIMNQLEQNKARFKFIDYVSDIIVYGTLDDVVETRNLIIEEFNKTKFEQKDYDIIVEAIDLLKEKIQELQLGEHQ